MRFVAVLAVMAGGGAPSSTTHVKVMIDGHARSNAVDRQQMMHDAASTGDAATVAKLCLSDPAATDAEGNTALHVASTPDVAMALIRCGGPVLAMALNSFGHSPMHSAAFDGNSGVLEVLTASVPSPARSSAGPAWTGWEGEGTDNTPLLIAVSGGHVAATQVLLRHAFCIQVDGKLSCAAIREPSAKRAMSVLVIAAEQAESNDTIEMLLRMGAKHMPGRDTSTGLEQRQRGTGADGFDSPFAHLLHSDENYRDDLSLDKYALYTTIGQLLGRKMASSHVPYTLYASMRHTDRAPLRQGILYRPEVQAAAAEHEASLRENHFAIVDSVYDEHVLTVLRAYYHNLIESGALSTEDPQSKRYVARNDKVSRLVHEDLTPLISLLAGRAVKPTYTYFAGYVHGSKLPLHTDRNDCEYTVSLSLQREPARTPWPIHMEKRLNKGLTPGPKRYALSEAARIDIDWDENAFLIFKGRHHAHSRGAFTGNFSHQLLLHYVHSTEGEEAHTAASAKQALMRNGDDSSSRLTDIPAAAAKLASGDRIVRVDSGEIADATPANTTSLHVLVPRTEHFFYPSVALGHRQLLRHPPLLLETLSVSPRVFRVDDFLSAAECMHIRQLAQPELRPSILKSRGHPQQVAGGIIDPKRTSETAWLDRFFGVNRGAPETEVTRRVLERAVALVRVPSDAYAEGLQVLRYPPKGKYVPHVDWLPGHHPARLATLLVFLNDENTKAESTETADWATLGGGGATNFPLRFSKSYDEMSEYGHCKTGMTVAPRAGTALLFYNLQPRESATHNYALDWAAWHSGCNVTAGSKWVANVWIRNDLTKW